MLQTNEPDETAASLGPAERALCANILMDRLELLTWTGDVDLLAGGERREHQQRQWRLHLAGWLAN